IDGAKAAAVIRNARTCDVDVAQIRVAHAVRRHVDVARCEREPRDVRTGGERRRDGGFGADPGDECGRVHRSPAVWSRYPAPRPIQIRPATIVKWRIAPGLSVHPGPAPRGDPHPAADAVRRPTDGNGSWKPHIS